MKRLPETISAGFIGGITFSNGLASPGVISFSLIDMTDKEIWDSYNNLLLGPDVERIRKLLARYEIFRMTKNVPGDIVECGVFKGAGLMYWLKLLRIFAPASPKRVIGFDTFDDAFDATLLPYEKRSAESYLQEATFGGVSTDDILKCAKEAGLEKGVELVKGDVQKTAERYIAENPGTRISLLHLDLDTYAGTKAALEFLYPVVSPGGVIVLDEYGMRGWGESDAVDEYFASREVKVRSLAWAYKPTAFVIKK